ncbi:hypothetical protein [Brucella sp.]|uniref:hypothetical protein n=1 Tax=Brucella sp. TaxID=52132 RepID=UPI0028B00FBA|nr:hypothetical protein [Brucella sp.]
MFSKFAEFERLISDRVDDVMGERTLVTHYKKAEFVAAAPDPEREPLEVVGVVDFTPTIPQMQDRGRYDGFIPSLAGDKIIVSYDQYAFKNPSDRPVDGTVIETMDRPQNFRLRVTRADPDELGRIVCVCEVKK